MCGGVLVDGLLGVFEFGAVVEVVQSWAAVSVDGVVSVGDGVAPVNRGTTTGSAGYLTFSAISRGGSASSPSTTKKVLVWSAHMRATRAGSYLVHFGYHAYDFLGVYVSDG